MSSGGNTSSISESTTTTKVNIQTLKKKIEAGEHYFTTEELDAIWWDGYEHGSIDSAYDCYDKGYAAAISDLESIGSLKSCDGYYEL